MAPGTDGGDRRPRRHDATAGDPDVPADGLRAEPEPEWADAIRRGRRDRAERLRTVFASFDDEDAGGVVPPQIDRSDTPSRQGPPRERPEP